MVTTGQHICSSISLPSGEDLIYANRRCIQNQRIKGSQRQK